MGPFLGNLRGRQENQNRESADPFAEMKHERSDSLTVLCQPPIRKIKQLMRDLGLVTVDPGEVDRDGNKRVLGQPLFRDLYERLHKADKDLRGLALLPAVHHGQLEGFAPLVAEITELSKTLVTRMADVKVDRAKKALHQSLLNTSKALASQIALVKPAAQA